MFRSSRLQPSDSNETSFDELHAEATAGALPELDNVLTTLAQLDRSSEDSAGVFFRDFFYSYTAAQQVQVIDGCLQGLDSAIQQDEPARFFPMLLYSLEYVTTVTQK